MLSLYPLIWNVPMSMLYLLPAIVLFTLSVELALRSRSHWRWLAALPAVAVASAFALFAAGYIWIYPMRMGVWSSFGLVVVGFSCALQVYAEPRGKG